MYRRQLIQLTGALVLAGLLMGSARGQVIVRVETSLGDIDVELYDQDAPVTVENFLRYVRNSRYNGTFIHRDLPGFVVQGGGYGYIADTFVKVPEYDPIMNEFDSSRSNVRGTIAMAKLPGNPNSATSEWFFNLGDNSANLDAQNGGFTVFGRVINDGMTVVDTIAALDQWDLSGLSFIYGGAFTDVPLINYTFGNTFDSQYLVQVERIFEIYNVSGNQALLLDNNNNVVTLTGLASTTFSNVSASANPHPSTAPDNVTFDEGFFSFQIDGVSPGGRTSVAMQLPSGFVPNTYYMYGPTPNNPNDHWYEFKYDGRTGAEFFGNNFVVLNFVDGERGDSDLTANGQIRDPGAPGIGPATSSNPGGGGCTLAAHPDSTPAPLDYLLIIGAIAGLRKYRAQTVSAWQIAKTS